MVFRDRLAARVPFFYGWVVVYAAGSSMFVRSAAASLTLAVFIYPIGQDLGWSRTLIAGSTSAAGIAAMFITPVTGWMVDRFGPRTVLGLAVLVLGVSTMSLRWATVPIAFYVAYGTGRIMFNSHIQIGAATVVAQWFVKRRGRATAILGVSHAAGMGLFPLTAQFLINETGDWRLAWFWLGLIVWAVALAPVWLLIVRRPEDLGTRPDAGRRQPPADAAAAEAATAVVDEHPWTLREAMRTPALWMLAVVGGMMFFVQAGTNVHQAAFLRDQGLSATSAAFALTLLATGSATGSLAWGLLTDRLRVRTVYIGVALWISGVALLFPTVSGAGGAFAIAFAFGIGLGGLLVVPPVAVAEYFGRRSLGSIRGVTEPFVGLGQAAGALGAGLVYDLTGAYTAVFPTFSALAGMAVLILLFIRPARYPGRETGPPRERSVAGKRASR